MSRRRKVYECLAMICHAAAAHVHKSPCMLTYIHTFCELDNMLDNIETDFTIKKKNKIYITCLKQ